MSDLSIRTRQDSECPAVSIAEFRGEMDAPSSGGIRSCFSSLVAKGRTFAVVEMSGVTHVCSAAIGELMGCRRMLIEQGGDLVLAGVSLDIKSKLNLMGANKIFSFYRDVRTALGTYCWEYEGKSDEIRITFSPELGSVPPVRQLVARIAGQKGYNRRDSFRIETIVDEICNNAIEHGDPRRGHDVEVTISINKEKIEIEVINRSDPNKISYLQSIAEEIAKSRRIPEDRRRGRGLALIRMLSQDMNINFSDTGTCVHIKKVREDIGYGISN